MINILTETNEEYQKIKKFIENEKGLDSKQIGIYRPNDCLVFLIWSIDDVRGHFPPGTSDDIIKKGLEKIKDTMITDMTFRGYQTVSELMDDMLSVIPKEDK